THLKSIAKPDPESKYGDLLADEKIVRIFQGQYEAITGTKPVHAKDLVQLLRDHGAQLLSMAERPLPIGIVSYSAKKCDEVAIKKFVRAMFNALEEEGLLGDVSLVGGLSNVGGIKASYDAAATYPDVETQGVMAPPGVFWPTA